MLMMERHREIIHIVDTEGSIRVTELARTFQVTEETIRRDLEKLESEGKLMRSHGGAVSVRTAERETPYSVREMSFAQEKAAIAREAVKRVEEGDTILLDASSTAWQMARLLPDMRLTVVTNAIKVAVELADRTNIRVISTGGSLSAPSLSFVGPLAEKTLEEYYVGKLFFSCKGIDIDSGLSDANETTAMLKKRMMSIADKRFLLADHSKFGVRALKGFAQLSELYEVVTDDKLDPGIAGQLRELGIRHTLVTP